MTLDQIRVSRQITQAELATRAGVSRTVVWRAESGLPVRPLTVQKIRAALDYDGPIDGVLVYRGIGRRIK